MERVRVADIGLDSRLAGSDAVYSYLWRDGVEIGQAYIVSLGPRKTVGYVLGIRDVSDEELGFKTSLLKPLGDRISEIDLPETLVHLIHEVSSQTLSPVSISLGLAAPPGLKDRLVTIWERTELPWDDGLSTAMKETLRVLEEGPITDGKGKRLNRQTSAVLRALLKRGLVKQRPYVQPFAERNRLQGSLRLTSDTDRVEKFLRTSGRRKPAQAVTIMRLQGSESASFTAQEIKLLGQVSDATLKSLVAEGLLEDVAETEQERQRAPKANEAQQRAIDAIVNSIEKGEDTAFLLYGVTGSGKTEVYLQAAQETLKQGKQVLFLVPEIALTAQVVAQLRARFGQRVAVMHSNLSPFERMENWMRIRAGEAPVVLGARSALFAPLSRLGLIVMDEEHEASYKQDSAPRYHTKRLAKFLASQFGAPLVMGSATPSVETFHEAIDGTTRRLDLPARAVAKATLPEVFIEDLREIYKVQKATIFSPRLREFMADTLAAKEQVILFLNRRAYAPFVTCRDCGHRFECPRCSVSLAFHRRDDTLRCHHCDYSIAAPKICPECDGDRVGSFGVGAQKVEEAVTAEFPEAKVLRLDRDIARKRGGLEEVLAKFRSGEANVLVGTQMVAKGLDFPQVTLVGVIAADMSLNIPDFRASERTFQLLTQVAGRAGRGEKPGRVVIQTLNPVHPSIRAAQTHDYETLFQGLSLERKEAVYPPFVRIVNILVLGTERHQVFEVSEVLGQKLRTELPDIQVLGPTNCALEKLNESYRRHLILKVPDDFNFHLVREVVDSVPSGKVRVTIDVDAYNLS